MEVFADVTAALIMFLTLVISFYFRTRLKTVERILLWMFCVIYITIFSYSALDMANPEWLKYTNRLAMVLFLVDMIYRVKRRTMNAA